MSGSDKVVLFYHAPCLDGAAAAWSGYAKWGGDAEYIGINHDTLEATRKLILYHADKNTRVVFADYAPPRQLMDEIAAGVKEVAIYDHHASAIRALQGYHNDKVKLVLDEARAGGAILYDEIFPGQPRPQAVELAQMIDLEQADRKDFFAVAAYFDSLPLGNIKDIVRSFDTINALPLQHIIERGQSLRELHTGAIDEAMDSMLWTKASILPGADPIYIPFINADPHHLGREFSIRLRQLAEQTAPGFVALSWFEDQGIMRVSVRSNSIPDAAIVAAHLGSEALGHGLGGGGHPTSAAAQFTLEQFHAMFQRFTRQQVLEAQADPDVVIDEPSALKLSGNHEKNEGRGA